ncbi:MAG TPA: C45 family peptidase [Polyangia bacterium]|nr:C45 family peptidase [Polyangia bacterium]
MAVPEIDLDLSLPPGERWRGLAAHADAAGRLLDCYLRDLSQLGAFAPLIESYADAFVGPEHRAEVASIAHIVGRPERDVLLGSLYYDAFRQLIGCTAFACDGPDGPIHARNLDWWTEDKMLARLTCLVNAHGGNAIGPYQMVSWPGFIGALSGLAPGRFSVTLNAAISNERPSLAAPVVLVLRRVLESCRDFGAAVDLLERTPIAADCLLLVAGTRQGEMAVIERTSTRAAVRGPERGFVAVTNDYRSLAAVGSAKVGDRLQETACARFDRAVARLSEALPQNPAECLQILSDPSVRMSITVQQMVMVPRTGELAVEIPT